MRNGYRDAVGTLMVVAGVALLSTGCGSSDPPRAASADAALDVAADGDAVVDTGGETPEPVPTGPAGSAIVSQAGFMGEDTHLLQASFRRESRVAGCSVERVDGCDVTTCEKTGTEPPPEGGTRPHAGTIRFSKGSTSHALSPAADGQYMSVQHPNLLFVRGEAVTISAEGAAGQVPAFAATLTAPGPTTMKMPPANSSGVVEIDRARPFEIELTTATAGDELELYLSVATDRRDVEVVCAMPVPAGPSPRVAVPASVVARLPAGSGGDMNVGTRRAETLRRDGWSVTAMLYWSSSLPDGRAAAFEVATAE